MMTFCSKNALVLLFVCFSIFVSNPAEANGRQERNLRSRRGLVSFTTIPPEVPTTTTTNSSTPSSLNGTTIAETETEEDDGGGEEEAHVFRPPKGEEGEEENGGSSSNNNNTDETSLVTDVETDVNVNDGGNTTNSSVVVTEEEEVFGDDTDTSNSTEPPLVEEDGSNSTTNGTNLNNETSTPTVVNGTLINDNTTIIADEEDAADGGFDSGSGGDSDNLLPETTGTSLSIDETPDQPPLLDQESDSYDEDPLFPEGQDKADFPHGTGVQHGTINNGAAASNNKGGLHADSQYRGFYFFYYAFVAFAAICFGFLGMRYYRLRKTGIESTSDMNVTVA